MALSAALLSVAYATVRVSMQFSCQSRQVHRFAPLRALLARPILHQGVQVDRPSSIWPIAQFSSSLSKKQSTDAELLGIIKSEIECAAQERREVEEVPKEFPFDIKDEEGANFVTLRRDYLGENIEVVVAMPKMEEEPDNVEDADDGELSHVGDEKISQPAIPLTINITKEKGLNLEFCCTACADEVVIGSLSVQRKEESEDSLAYEGPDFSDLDENLQKAFYKFLEMRGISPATTNFLYEYMINKEDREYSRWLHNLKQFIEK